MPADGWTISGLVLGVLGLTGLGQLAWCCIYTYLPEQRLNALDDLLDETGHIFKAAVEDGLLKKAKINDLERRLAQYGT